MERRGNGGEVIENAEDEIMLKSPAILYPVILEDRVRNHPMIAEIETFKQMIEVNRITKLGSVVPREIRGGGH